MDEDRIKHSIAVARKMVEIAKNKNLSEKDGEKCSMIQSLQIIKLLEDKNHIHK